MVEWAAMIPAVPVPDIPGQSVLACAGPATSTTVDRICGDGDDSYTDQSLGGDIGVLTSLRADDNQLRLRFDPLGNPSRHLTVFIPERFTPLTSNECVTNCLAAGTGQPISNTVVTVEVRDGQDARIQTTMRETGGNPRDLVIGQSAPIDVLIGWDDPFDRGYRWALYWSPVNYAGSTTATITRTGSCTWDLEASEDEIVGLILFRTGNGNNRTRSEGRFSMPFKLTFTADALGMPGGCPSLP